MTAKSPITTHVLDISRGRPATGVSVVLSIRDGSGWKELGRGATNADGRVADLLSPGSNLHPSHYRLVFSTAGYFQGQGVEKFFYPEVEIRFQIEDPGQHYHVPLLLSPFGYSTYRGS